MLSRRKLIKNAGYVLGAEFTSPAILGAFQQDQTKNGPTQIQERATDYVARAEGLKPDLHELAQPPVRLVKPVADPTYFLRWRMESDGAPESLTSKTFRAGDSFIVDFGGHRTGYLSFALEGVGRSVDAPTRLRLIFGEVPGDVSESLHPYKGSLSEGWLPEEIITVDFLPQKVRMPRRYAFRYVKVEVIATSPNYAARFGDFEAHAVTSASGTIPPLPNSFSEELRRIDEVSIATLRDCMQTVFEDGPRRDQRLWIGDLRLQALANYATYRNFSLVRRCMYLLAAFPREDGLLHADVFEKPKPTASGDVCLDYAALFVAVLADYVKASGDLVTGRELWPVAKRQLEIISKNLNGDGLFVDPRNVWIFVDWQPSLEHTASMHGILLCCYRHGLELAQVMKDDHAVSEYTGVTAKMTSAGRAAFYDEERKVFVSGSERQVSWASQAWLVLAGVVTEEAAATALKNAMADAKSVRPGAPYMYHYVVSALLQCGQRQEATKLIEDYWGAMVANGADTFWEVFNPADSRMSPYGDVHINSFCHAWSCTPSYFLRTPALLGDSAVPKV
jgi:alpha-L-rhamnosidase